MKKQSAQAHFNSTSPSRMRGLHTLSRHVQSPKRHHTSCTCVHPIFHFIGKTYTLTLRSNTVFLMKKQSAQAHFNSTSPSRMRGLHTLSRHVQSPKRHHTSCTCVHPIFHFIGKTYTLTLRSNTVFLMK